jgi:hypothetical protein
VTECPIPAAAEALNPRRLTAYVHRNNRSAAWPVITPAENLPKKMNLYPVNEDAKSD